MAQVIVVSSTIQAAVDAAQPGDTVRIPPGTYRESVSVTKNDISIEGSPGAVLEGEGLKAEMGIKVAPVAPVESISRFKLTGLTIQNYSKFGVRLSHVEDFHITHGRFLNNGANGIFPVRSVRGRIDFNHVSGSNDSGIYIGSSREVTIEKNVSSDCTMGIEVQSSARIDVVSNEATGNSIGIVVWIFPGRPIKATTDVNVRDNVLNKNNRPNPHTGFFDVSSRLPSGVGLLCIATDRMVASHNHVNHNNSAGIAVVRLPSALAALDPQLDPFPHANQIVDNVVLHNGSVPDPKVAPLPGGDLLWDTTGEGNCWTGNNHKTAFPPALPACP